jgi:hypothetical protein
MMVLVFYKTRNSHKVYRGPNNVLVDPANIKVNAKNQKVYAISGFPNPTLTDPAGTNLFDVNTQFMTVIMKGKEYVEIERSYSIVVDFGLAPMTMAQFYGTYIVQNLAKFLGIPFGNIKVVGAFGIKTARRRRRSAGSMKVTIEITSSGGQSYLVTLSYKLIDEIQKGTLSLTLNCTINYAAVSSPPPKPGSPEYAAYIVLTDKLGRRPPRPVGVPNSLMFEKHPEVSSEGTLFKTQPSLRFTDSKVSFLGRIMAFYISHLFHGLCGVRPFYILASKPPWSETSVYFLSPPRPRGGGGNICLLC